MLIFRTGKKTYVIRPTEFTKVCFMGLIGLVIGAIFGFEMNEIHPLF